MSQFGSFWSMLNFAHHSSRIEEMLNSPDTTIEQLLDDDNIISEFKSLNPKLLEYCTDERIKQLMQYILIEPPEDADKARGYKYPFVACEILTADLQTIQSAFFGKNPNNNLKSKDNQNDSSNEFEEYQSSPNSDHKAGSDDEGNEGEAQTEDKEAKKDKEDKEDTEDKVEKEDKVENEVKEEKEGKDEKDATEEKEGTEETQPEPTEPKTDEITTEKKIEGDTSVEDKTATPEKEPQDKKEDNKEEEEKKEPEEPEEPIASYFFKFLEAPTLNITLVGYFCRFLNHLILRRYSDIAEYVWTNPKVIENMIRHLSFRNIAECLARLITLENVSLPGSTFTEDRIKAVGKVMEIFNGELKDLDEEVLGSASYIICEIINKRSSVLGGAEFEEYFGSKEFLDVVFNNLFRDDELTGTLTLIINALLQLHLNAKNNGNKGTGDANDSSEAIEEVLTGSDEENYLYDCLEAKIGDINEYLHGNQSDEVDTTFGSNQKPFGTTRLKLVETLLLCIKLKVNKIAIEIRLKKIYNTLMELMVKYEWNNMLHNLIEKIFITTLEGDSHILKNVLLNQAGLLDFLNNTTETTQFTFPNQGGRQIRKGYLGQLTRIAQKIEKIAETDSELKEYINNEKWKNFNEKYLKPTVTTETMDLAGYHKRESEDSEENIYTHFEHGNHEENPESMDDDDEEGSPKKDVHTNVDSLDTGKDSSDWTTHKATDHNKFAHSDKDFWLLPDFPEDIEGNYNKYLELNRQLEIIDIGPQHETKLEEKFLENQYWAHPHDKSVSIDDILKEFEGF